ncbi:MAG: type II toxin-antitoxin system RelE/ParE family toxin [Bacteroidia bacterium]|nr:type II toxin-antitoxin system RelE/ParE family toxin [Bacteroidia bacterium]
MLKFEIEFLEEAKEFLNEIDNKAKEKLIYNIDKARQLNDPKIFKKLEDDIWEFRAEVKKMQYRILAFWDKRNRINTLVVCIHGFIKKEDKVPKSEIEKAKRIMKIYFETYK